MLKAAESFLFEWVRPRAAAIDQDLAALREALDEMGRRGLLGLRVPVEFGGGGMSDRDFRRFQETSARCSGALAFLESQHQSACTLVAKCDNGPLREKLLPRLACGASRSAIAFSQLRKAGEPALRATPRNGGGTVLDGTLPWITGWGLFDLCMTAATLPDGRTLFVTHKLIESPSLRPSPILRLAAVEVAQTVSAEVRGLAIPDEDVLGVHPATWIEQNDLLSIALQSPLALGCAQAGIDVMREKQDPAIRAAADRLESELSKCREEAYAAMDDREDAARSLRARSGAIELAGRCAHAAVVASAGAGNMISHPAQRIYREALAFTVLAQTRAIQEATLDRLTRR